MRHFRLKFLTFLLVSFLIIVSIFICEFILRFVGLGDPVIYDKNPVWNYSLSENQKVFVFFSPTKNSLSNNQSELNKNLKKKILMNVLNIYDMTSTINKNLNKKIYYDNVHFNDRGHEIISEIISQHIKDKLK